MRKTPKRVEVRRRIAPPLPVHTPSGVSRMQPGTVPAALHSWKRVVQHRRTSVALRWMHQKRKGGVSGPFLSILRNGVNPSRGEGVTGRDTS